MKKWAKPAGITAAVLIALGLILVTVGLFMGAESGVYLTRNGLKLAETKDYDYEKLDIEAVKEIDIDVSNARVEFKASENDKFGISVSVCDNSGEPVIKTDNGKISVEQKSGFHLFSINFDIWSLFSEKGNTVTVYIPKNASLNNISVDTSNGAIDMQSQITTKELELHTSNGKITIDNMTCTDKADIKTSNGAVNCNGSFNKDTYLKSSNGRIELTGSYKGKTYVKTSNGAITFTTTESEKSYNIEAETSNGSIKVNGVKVSDDYNQKSAGASNTLELDTSNGSVSIDFGS